MLTQRLPPRLPGAGCRWRGLSENFCRPKKYWHEKPKNSFTRFMCCYAVCVVTQKQNSSGRTHKTFFSLPFHLSVEQHCCICMEIRTLHTSADWLRFNWTTFELSEVFNNFERVIRGNFLKSHRGCWCLCLGKLKLLIIIKLQLWTTDTIATRNTEWEGIRVESRVVAQIFLCHSRNSLSAFCVTY